DRHGGAESELASNRNHSPNNRNFNSDSRKLKRNSRRLKRNSRKLNRDSRKLNSESRQTHRHGGYDRQGTTSTERQRIDEGRTPACTPPHLTSKRSTSAQTE